MTRRTVVVTGATKGLGRATAMAFVRAGQRVLGLYATDDTAAGRLRSELQALDPESDVVKHDVRRENPKLWRRPEIVEGRGLVLINNACAPFAPQPFHLQTWPECERGLDVGLKGSWLCSQALLRPMLRCGDGTIVNVLSAAIHGVPPKGFAAYVAAKHALRGLTIALAAEYGSRGIRIFSISPGFMLTSLTSVWDARLLESVRKRGGIDEPADVASRILSLVEGASTPGRGEDYSVV